MLAITPQIDALSYTSETVCELVDRNYAGSVQTSGQLVSGKYYIFNTPPSSRSFGENFNLIVMRVDQLSKVTKHLIGENGETRFNRFLEYGSGWDGANAKPLSLESVAMLEMFTSKYNSFHTEPSLFMTKKGNLKLGWEDIYGKSIEIEFMPSSFKYFIENNEEEGYIAISEVDDLINKLRLIDNVATTA